MIKSEVVAAGRHLRKQRAFVVINIAGLSFGLACCILIALFVRSELSYDSFHRNAERIFLFKQFDRAATAGGKFAETLPAFFPDIESTTRLFRSRPLIGAGENRFYEEKFYFADSTFLDIFSFPLKQGNPANALHAPFSVVLTEAAAKRYFGSENPLGQTLRYENRFDLTVTGVLEPLPDNSHMQFDFLATFQNAQEMSGNALHIYWNNVSVTYVLVKPGADAAAIQTRFPDYLESNLGRRELPGWKLALIPLRDAYLKAHVIGDVRATNALDYVYAFSLIGLFILVIACFNYMNLASARAATRVREIGVRKVLGAQKWQLVRQLLGESLITTSLAALLAVVAVELILPTFNSISGKSLSLNLLSGPLPALSIAGLVLFTALLAGSYPAFFLARLHPVRILKMRFSSREGGGFRKALVVLQFTISISMIAATAIVYQQLEYVQTKNLGYEREHVLVIDLRGGQMRIQFSAFKQAALAVPGVASITAATGVPGTGEVMIWPMLPDLMPEDKREDLGIQLIQVDEDYLETFGIEIADGRDFEPEFSADDLRGFLLNEAALRKLGWTEGVSKRFGYTKYVDGQPTPVEGRVVGVIRDFHYSSLHATILPLMLQRRQVSYGQLAVRLASQDIRTTMDALRDVWTAFSPDRPFVYSFLDADYDAAYRKERRTGTIMAVFAGVAIFISCLGLLGLVAFTAEQRMREIGIRKVLGASAASIVVLLTRDLTRLILAAFVLACPVAWYVASNWLDDFAYRIDIGPQGFLMAGAAAMLIAWFTLAYQALKSSRVNPASVLKSE